jgi:preprotein translocase subunit YajC
MHKHKEFCLWAVGLVFAGLFFSATCSAQMDDSKAKASSQSVTGCLQKGDEAGGVTITGADGKVWELHSKKVKLSEHVGHTVTVTGAAVKQSKATEEKMEPSEKKEASGKEYGDLRVDSLKMVSDSCK